MGTQLGPGVMYILSQLMQKKLAETQAAAEETETLPQMPAKNPEESFFAADETGASWHRETDLELLKQFCREGYGQAARYGHFLIGTGEERNYIAVPGRFLLEEQPAGGRTGFTLWQPLRGGEELYSGLGDMDEATARLVYGYWIAALDSRTLEISEA